MADHYTQATVQPAALPVPEKLIEALFGPEEDDHLPNEEAVVARHEFISKMLEVDPWTMDLYKDEEWALPGEDEGGFFCCNISCEKWSEEEGGRFLYMKTTLSDLDLVVLRTLLKHYLLPEVTYLTVEAAHTCSKIRPGTMGGFAAVITRKGMECFSTHEWINERLDKLEDKNAYG